jgi:diguanylate cyclase (GGDEF)-like protein
MPFREACLGRHQLPGCVDDAINAAQTSGRRCALLVINLRRFREVNVDFGFETGDRVLLQLVERVTTILKDGDKLFHIGSDEFAVLLEDIKSPQVAHMALGRVLDELDKGFEVSGQLLSIIAQGGAAVYPDHVDRADTMLKAADAALMEARDRGKRSLLFDFTLREGRRTQADLRAKLHEALDNNDLQLYYQPQVNLRDGSVSGFEALVRWQHAGLGWIGPDQFIPVAESCGLIENLTYWSFNVALRECAAFCQKGSSATLSINLSAKMLESNEVVDLLGRAINIWGVDPSLLVLEVTESAMMADPQAALDILVKIHAMGVTLSIDDFGTGYSSLDYLKRLPVSELKIDKSFVLNMADDRQDRKIVQSIIDLAHNLDMHVVAEGIEDQRVFDMLDGMGCDIGQGFHMARPMPVSALSEWLDGGFN